MRPYACFVVLGLWLIKNSLWVAVNFHQHCRMPSVSPSLLFFRRLQLRRLGGSSSDRKVAGSNHWLRAEVSLSKILKPPDLQSVYEYVCVLSAVLLIVCAVQYVEEGCRLSRCFNTPQSSLCSAGILPSKSPLTPSDDPPSSSTSILFLLTKPPFGRRLLNVLSKGTSETESGWV